MNSIALSSSIFVPFRSTYSVSALPSRVSFSVRANAPPPVVSGSSFTALLGLPPPQAVELLHHPYEFPQNFSPTFPSNAALVDRAARLSVFAAEAKAEPADSCGGGDERRVAGKRKELEKSKVKGSVKKSKSAEEVTDGDEKQLPYVHVRARRGQATDSHSLAERARREKINARMKLLQELVPGCNKISGTALVLDEIINHVQSLQRQVEFLSMRLATVNPTVNPRVEFGGIENILSSECGRLTLGSGLWLDGMMNGPKEPQQQSYHQLQQNWLVDHHRQQQWESDDTQNGHIFVSNPNTTTTSIFNYDTSTPDSVPHPNQLKTEM